MTCDKCGQEAGPGRAPPRPLIGQRGLINNGLGDSPRLAQWEDVLRSATAPGQAFMGLGSSRRALARHRVCAGGQGGPTMESSLLTDVLTGSMALALSWRASYFLLLILMQFGHVKASDQKDEVAKSLSSLFHWAVCSWASVALSVQWEQ